MAIASGTAMLGSAVLGGIGSAASGRSSRKAQDKQNQLSAEQAALDRQHEKEMFERQRKVYTDAASSWKKYDFGAKPLSLLQSAQAPTKPALNTFGAGGAMQGQRGLLPNEEFV